MIGKYQPYFYLHIINIALIRVLAYMMSHIRGVTMKNMCTICGMDGTLGCSSVALILSKKPNHKGYVIDLVLGHEEVIMLFIA